MAFFGAFSPLPGPLGGSDEEGWAAAHHARLCADLAAAKRALPFALVTIFRDNGSSPEITAVNMQAPETVANVPSVSGTSTTVTFTFPDAPESELGEKLALKITRASWTRHDSQDAYANVTAPNVVVVTFPGVSADIGGTLTVFAEWGPRARIERYGGSLRKRDSSTERTPYAWTWYNEIGASLGDAYGVTLSGAVHAKKLATARVFAAVSRSIDKFRANSTPSTAHLKLDDWARTLRVPVTSQSMEWDTRRLCSVMLAAEPGGSITALQRACFALLGETYVGIITFGPDEDPGVWSHTFAINGVVWATNRSRIILNITPPSDANDLSFKELVDIQAMSLLDRLTPAHVMFDWAATSELGFRLGISRLGIDGL